MRSFALLLVCQSNCVLLGLAAARAGELVAKRHEESRRIRFGRLTFSLRQDESAERSSYLEFMHTVAQSLHRRGLLHHMLPLPTTWSSAYLTTAWSDDDHHNFRMMIRRNGGCVIRFNDVLVVAQRLHREALVPAEQSAHVPSQVKLWHGEIYARDDTQRVAGAPRSELLCGRFVVTRKPGPSEFLDALVDDWDTYDAAGLTETGSLA